MRRDEYLTWAQRAAAWCADYLATLRERPVRAQTSPGEIAARLPASPPEDPVSMDVVLQDFERIVPDGITHWQHPRFFAYFPANAAPASMIADQLSSVLAAQCMLWQTSPAATEIEERMVDWARQALGLPEHFRGFIQDTGTTANLCAVLTMREKALGWRGLEEGLSTQPKLRVYASPETHSSIDKAVRLAGIGQQNLVKVPTGDTWALEPEALREAIQADLEAGHVPAGVVLCVGGTSIGASDMLEESIAVAKSFDLPVHVDAAWAGSAMIVPELRDHWRGIDGADSVMFNPHKWLGAQFDCSIQFLADPADQVRTMSLRPDYLKTLDATGAEASVTDFSEWTIPLGRRFRALKLWFVFRAYGLEGLRQRVRNHLTWSREAQERIAALPHLSITTPCQLSLFTFRFAPPGQDPDDATRRLLAAINDDGRTYLTQTTHEDDFVIRFQVGSFDCERQDVMDAVDVVAELAQRLTRAGA